MRPVTTNDTRETATGILSAVERDGFIVVDDCISSDQVRELSAHLPAVQTGKRDLLSDPAVQRLATSPRICELASAVLGDTCFAVRASFFDKTTDGNWKVAWHQDRTIAVKERIEVEGFGPWSVKEGIVHVQPPAGVLEGLLAIRIHLEENDEENGPLRVIPGSHHSGVLSGAQIDECVKHKSYTCLVPSGGVLLMRPLIVHASSSCKVPSHRRVIHIEYAARPLPGVLEWNQSVRV